MRIIEKRVKSLIRELPEPLSRNPSRKPSSPKLNIDKAQFVLDVYGQALSDQQLTLDQYELTTLRRRLEETASDLYGITQMPVYPSTKERQQRATMLFDDIARTLGVSTDDLKTQCEKLRGSYAHDWLNDI